MPLKSAQAEVGQPECPLRRSHPTQSPRATARQCFTAATDLLSKPNLSQYSLNLSISCSNLSKSSSNMRCINPVKLGGCVHRGQPTTASSHESLQRRSYRWNPRLLKRCSNYTYCTSWY